MLMEDMTIKRNMKLIKDFVDEFKGLLDKLVQDRKLKSSIDFKTFEEYQRTIPEDKGIYEIFYKLKAPSTSREPRGDLSIPNEWKGKVPKPLKFEIGLCYYKSKSNTYFHLGIDNLKYQTLNSESKIIPLNKLEFCCMPNLMIRTEKGNDTIEDIESMKTLLDDNETKKSILNYFKPLTDKLDNPDIFKEENDHLFLYLKTDNIPSTDGKFPHNLWFKKSI